MKKLPFFLSLLSIGFSSFLSAKTTSETFYYKDEFKGTRTYEYFMDKDGNYVKNGSFSLSIPYHEYTNEWSDYIGASCTFNGSFKDGVLDGPVSGTLIEKERITNLVGVVTKINQLTRTFTGRVENGKPAGKWEVSIGRNKLSAQFRNGELYGFVKFTSPEKHGLYNFNGFINEDGNPTGEWLYNDGTTSMKMVCKDGIAIKENKDGYQTPGIIQQAARNYVNKVQSLEDLASKGYVLKEMVLGMNIYLTIEEMMDEVTLWEEIDCPLGRRFSIRTPRYYFFEKEFSLTSLGQDSIAYLMAKYRSKYPTKDSIWLTEKKGNNTHYVSVERPIIKRYNKYFNSVLNPDYNTQLAYITEAQYKKIDSTYKAEILRKNKAEILPLYESYIETAFKTLYNAKVKSYSSDPFYKEINDVRDQLKASVPKELYRAVKRSYSYREDNIYNLLAKLYPIKAYRFMGKDTSDINNGIVILNYQFDKPDNPGYLTYKLDIKCDIINQTISNESFQEENLKIILNAWNTAKHLSYEVEGSDQRILHTRNYYMQEPVWTYSRYRKENPHLLRKLSSSDDPNQRVAGYEALLKIQEECIQIMNLGENMYRKNEEIIYSDLAKSFKKATRLYKKYWNSADLSWTIGGNDLERFKEISETQEKFEDLLHKADPNVLETTIKEQKIKTLEQLFELNK